MKNAPKLSATKVFRIFEVVQSALILTRLSLTLFSFLGLKSENLVKPLDEAQNLCKIGYYKRSISSALDRNLQMKRRLTSANLHRPSQRP
ncbi:hypothetical protein, partial [Acaryochloris sp. IP29b_bin.137]|uniref:hypothetical protein n=1 Tax=Acaryochloris sp. IP29b_bin.137 TaxID=2969217 RepID=UPI002622309E